MKNYLSKKTCDVTLFGMKSEIFPGRNSLQIDSVNYATHFLNGSGKGKGGGLSVSMAYLNFFVIFMLKP